MHFDLQTTLTIACTLGIEIVGSLLVSAVRHVTRAGAVNALMLPVHFFWNGLVMVCGVVVLHVGLPFVFLECVFTEVWLAVCRIPSRIAASWRTHCNAVLDLAAIREAHLAAAVAKTFPKKAA